MFGTLGKRGMRRYQLRSLLLLVSTVCVLVFLVSSWKENDNEILLDEFMIQCGVVEVSSANRKVDSALFRQLISRVNEQEEMTFQLEVALVDLSTNMVSTLASSKQIRAMVFYRSKLSPSLIMALDNTQRLERVICIECPDLSEEQVNILNTKGLSFDVQFGHSFR
jgi:hypothetical protein